MISFSSFFKTKGILNASFTFFIVASSVLFFAFFVWSSSEARKTMSNRVIDWLPEGTEELQTFYRYYSHFPEGELLMVSWEGCDINDERLEEIAERLTHSPGNGKPPYFERTLTTRSVIEKLMEEPLNLPRHEAESRLSGWLIGRDRQSACLIALISEYGGLNRDEAVGYVFSVTSELTGLDEAKIYVGGPTVDSVAIDAISQRSQRTLLPFCLLFCLGLLFCCLRNFFVAIVVFCIALMNEELGGTLLYWTGAHVDSISMLISSFIYVLTISAGVHLVNYYRETLLETGDVANAPKEMVRKAFLPCSLAVLTTVLGLGSLLVSKMVPIRTFGIYSSVSLVLGVAWLFLFVAIILRQFPVRKWAKESERLASANDGEKPSLTPGIRIKSNYWDAFGLMIERFRYPLAVISLAGMIFCCFGVKHLRTSVTFHGMLPDTAKVIRDYGFLEEKIGGLIPVEIVLHVPDAGNEKTTILDQLYLVRAIQEKLRSVRGIDTVISALNFTTDLPSQTDRTLRASATRTAVNRLLQSHIDRLKEARFYDRNVAGEENRRPDGPGGVDQTSDRFWRLSLRTASGASLDYEALLDNIRTVIDGLREDPAAKNVKDWSFEVTGGVPLVHKAQQQLLEDLIESFITAFALIALTMILMLRGVVRGLLAMIPNLFPCILVFGTLGWLNMPIDIGSMMTASVAMGIAVDGTLHYLTWFNIGLKQGRDRRNAVFYAYHCCATALVQTTLICGLGLLVFALSDFVPVARFSLLMCILLIASLIGDIIVLPAIILTPIGRIFERRESRHGLDSEIDRDALP